MINMVQLKHDLIAYCMTVCIDEDKPYNDTEYLCVKVSMLVWL